MKITLDVNDVTGQLFLNQDVGDGEFDGNSFSVTVRIPSMSPVVLYQDKTYSISMSDIVQAICGAALSEELSAIAELEEA